MRSSGRVSPEVKRKPSRTTSPCVGAGYCAPARLGAKRSSEASRSARRIWLPVVEGLVGLELLLVQLERLVPFGVRLLIQEAPRNVLADHRSQLEPLRRSSAGDPHAAQARVAGPPGQRGKLNEGRG